MKKNEKILKIIFFSTSALVIVLFIIYFFISRQYIRVGIKPTPTPVYLPVLSNESSRVYKNHDASYSLVAHTGPENYQDENGNWLPISTKITPSKKQGYAYEVTTNKIKTYFKDILNQGDYLLLVDGDKKIYQGIERMQEGIGAINLNKAKVQDNIITYPEIIPGVDLRYRVSKDKIEEEFVIKNKEAAKKIRSFVEFITLENVTYHKDVEGNISLDKTINFSKPIMFESDNQANSSNDIEYLEVQSSINKFSLKKALTHAGIKWLNQEGRKFPIIIDPTVTYTGSAAGDDGSSKRGSGSAGQNVNGTSHIIGNFLTSPVMAGAAAYPTGAYAAGFRFQPNIPRGSTITSAYLYVYKRNDSQQVGGGDISVRLYGEVLTTSSGCPIYTSTTCPGGRLDSRTTLYQDWDQTTSDDQWIPNNPNINTVVNEVTSNANWTAGTSYLCIYIDNDTTSDKRVMVDAYGVGPTPAADTCGTGSAAPCLKINYTITSPSGGSATINDKDKVVLSWTGVTDVSQYKIYYSASSGTCASKSLLTTVNSATSHNDTAAPSPVINPPANISASTTNPTHIIVNVGATGTVTNGATRYYQIAAVSGDYESACSTEISGYRPAGTISSHNIYRDVTPANSPTPIVSGTASNPYNDTSAAAASLTAPSNLTTSTVDCDTIRLNIGTAGVSTNGTSRTYKAQTVTDNGSTSLLSSATSAGYRSYGTVSGYNIYKSDDSYATAIATNQSSPYSDNAAPTPVMDAKITPSAGSLKITFNVVANVTPGSRAYKAKTYAGPTGYLSSSFSSASDTGYTNGVKTYSVDVTDTVNGTAYKTLYQGYVLSSNDWTGCTLGAGGGYYRSYFKLDSTCQSPYSHTSGGVQASCTEPATTPAVQFEKVQMEKVKIAP